MVMMLRGESSTMKYPHSFKRGEMSKRINLNTKQISPFKYFDSSAKGKCGFYQLIDQLLNESSYNIKPEKLLKIAENLLHKGHGETVAVTPKHKDGESFISKILLEAERVISSAECHYPSVLQYAVKLKKQYHFLKELSSSPVLKSSLWNDVLHTFQNTFLTFTHVLLKEELGNRFGFRDEVI